MIDNFALALSHGLLILCAWRLLSRPDLEDDSIPAPPPPEQRSDWGDIRARIQKGRTPRA